MRAAAPGFALGSVHGRQGRQGSGGVSWGRYEQSGAVESSPLSTRTHAGGCPPDTRGTAAPAPTPPRAPRTGRAAAAHVDSDSKVRRRLIILLVVVLVVNHPRVFPISRSPRPSPVATLGHPGDTYDTALLRHPPTAREPFQSRFRFAPVTSPIAGLMTCLTLRPV